MPLYQSLLCSSINFHWNPLAGEGGRGQDLCEKGRGGEADPGDEGGQPRVARNLAAGGVQAVSRRWGFRIHSAILTWKVLLCHFTWERWLEQTARIRERPCPFIDHLSFFTLPSTVEAQLWKTKLNGRGVIWAVLVLSSNVQRFWQRSIWRQCQWLWDTNFAVLLLRMQPTWTIA